jgi:hypothetical protein
VFTTQTFSHILGRMRETIQSTPPPKVNVGSDGARAVSDAAQTESLPSARLPVPC